MLNKKPLAKAIALALLSASISSTTFAATNHEVIVDSLNAATGPGWQLSPLSEDVIEGLYAKTYGVKLALSADNQQHKIYQQGIWGDQAMDLVYQSNGVKETIFSLSPEMVTAGSMFYSDDIVVDSQGTVHVIFSYYKEKGYEGGYAKDIRVSFYAYKDATGWHVSEVPELADGHQFSLAVGSDNIPQVVYYTYRNAMYYAKYSETGWEKKKLSVYGSQPVIAVNSNNQPIVAYYDNSFRGTGYSVQSIVSSTYWRWTTSTIAGSGSQPSLVLDGQDNMHVSSSKSYGGLIYSQFDGTNWANEDVPNSFNKYTLPSSLVLGSDGEPVIAHQADINYPSNSSVEYRLTSKTGGSWQTEVIWGPSNRATVDLAVDSLGKPAVALSAIPYFNSNLRAGWTSSFASGLSEWATNAGFIHANPVGYDLRWDGVVIATPEPIAPVAEQGSYVVASGYKGADYFLRFDENGQYRSRMPSALDVGDNMKPNIKSNIEIGTQGIVQGDFDNDGLTDFISAGRENGTGENILEFHRKVGAIKNLFESDIRQPASVIDRPAFSYLAVEDFAAADFNNDGNLDFLMGESYSTRTHLYLGNGDGTFASPVALTGIVSAKGIDTEDLNNDGHADFVVSGNYYAWKMDVYLGDGTGNFSLNTLELDHNGSDVQTSVGATVSDFDGDGLADLVLTNYAGNMNNVNGLAFYKGNGDGSFVTTPTYSAPEIGFGYDRNFKSRAIDNAYFDNDQHMDLIVADQEQSTIGVYLGNGDGTFTQAPQHFAVHPESSNGNDQVSDGNVQLTQLDPALLEYHDVINLQKSTQPKGISTPAYSVLVKPSL